MTISFDDQQHAFNTLQHLHAVVQRTPGSKPATPYASFLASPASNIAGNVPERADVTFSAILGYN